MRRVLFGVLCILFFGCVFVLWKIATALPFERVTVVVDGEPVRVESWDNARKRLTVIPIPADVRIEGAGGMGSLPIASIRRLETLDPQKRDVFIMSLSDALAVPIVGTSQRTPWPLRLRFWWIMQRLRPDAIITVALEDRGVLRMETLPDGSTVRVFDTDRYDAVAGNQLEVDAIRREERRVRVVNTTDVAGLGNRAARLLSHAGMVVVAVESESPEQKECTVHANVDLWGDRSVTFIKDVFGCVLTAPDTDERADITVRLGWAYPLVPRPLP